MSERHWSFGGGKGRITERLSSFPPGLVPAVPIRMETFDIPAFVSMPSSATVRRMEQTRVDKKCGRRTVQESSSESSPASSGTSSPADSPRGPPEDWVASFDTESQLGLAGLHMGSEYGGWWESDRAKNTGSGAGDDAMGMNRGGYDHPSADAAVHLSSAREGKAAGKDEAEAGGRQQLAKKPHRKQVEFDQDGWEDVGDSDGEDPKLLGSVGQGEDDYYDPDMDDLDQQFMDNRRLRHTTGSRQSRAPKPPTNGRKAPQPTPASCRLPVMEEGRGAPREAMKDAGQSTAVSSSSASVAPCDAAVDDCNMQVGDGGEEASKGGQESGGGDGKTQEQGSSRSGEDEWRAYVAASGHEYYHNTRTGETTWTKPERFSGDGAAMKGPATRTDAMLSCPCCFALLCIDCQRHATYQHQYRAMFVQNCQVMRLQRMHAAAETSGGGARQAADVDESDVLYPVRCKTCQAEVAVMDGDEVFHFFHVIPSNG